MKNGQKKILHLILCLPLFFAISSSAQPYLGIFGGISTSKLNGDKPDKASYKRLIGFTFGANFDVKLSKTVYLSFQPSFSQEGTKIFYDVSKVEEPVDSLKVRLNYISVPVLFRVSSTNQRFYATGGIESAFLVESYTVSRKKKSDLSETISDINLVAHFGAGVRFPVGSSRIFLELRYTQGLINLTDEPVNTTYIPRVKTTDFRLIAGLELPLIKK